GRDGVTGRAPAELQPGTKGEEPVDGLGRGVMGPVIEHAELLHAVDTTAQSLVRKEGTQGAGVGWIELLAGLEAQDPVRGTTRRSYEAFGPVIRNDDVVEGTCGKWQISAVRGDETNQARRRSHPVMLRASP